jgi:hypothetical protein
MTGGLVCGWREQHLNEEVSYHERSLQDVMIDDLQMQVAKLTQHLAMQNIELYRNILTVAI